MDENYLLDKSILVVEDEIDSLELFQRFLKRKFKHVYLAHHGQEAVELLQMKKIDVVLTDISMPVMNGLALCSFIRRNFPRLRVAAVTAHIEPEMEEELDDHGFHHVIYKPVERPAWKRFLTFCQNEIF